MYTRFLTILYSCTSTECRYPNDHLMIIHHRTSGFSKN